MPASVKVAVVVPMSPYLFLLCAEGLSSMLKYVGPQFLSKGIRVEIRARWVSHSLFANDCLVFTQASEQGGTRLPEIICSYQEGSGQMVNVAKSAIFGEARRGEITMEPSVPAHLIHHQKKHYDSKITNGATLAPKTRTEDRILGSKSRRVSQIQNHQHKHVIWAGDDK
jgi:hypothetical protein